MMELTDKKAEIVKEIEFRCTRCGACCRRAHLIPFFKYADFIRCGCTMLCKNICNIYTSRPDICNVKKVNKKFFPNQSQKEYYRETASLCNQFIEEDGMDKRYLINLEQFKE